MSPSEDDPSDSPDQPRRADGSGVTSTDGSEIGDASDPDGSGVSDRASAFDQDIDYSMGQMDIIREIYDRKFYAPLQILLTDYRGIIGISTVVILLAMATIGVAVVQFPMQEFDPLLPPFQNWAAPLGTDAAGRATHRMLIHATPRMIQLMLGGSLFAASVGIAVGTVSGFKRGLTDRVLMTVTDTFLNLPGLPLLLVLVAVFQPTDPFLIGIILSVNSWPGTARSLRAQVLQIRNDDHVEAGRAMGMSTGRNIQKNVLPELLPLITIGLIGSLRGIIFAAIGLYFLGVLPATNINWGQMLNRSLNEADLVLMQDVGYLFVMIAFIAWFGIGMTFLAQSFDRVFNPRLRAKHAKTLVGGSDEEEDEDVDAAAKEVMLQ